MAEITGHLNLNKSVNKFAGRGKFVTMSDSNNYTQYSIIGTYGIENDSGNFVGQDRWNEVRKGGNVYTVDTTAPYLLW